jgi:aldose sugar dehydrogenase
MKYSDPEFVSELPIGPTALKFLHSDKLGKHLENNIKIPNLQEM